MPITASFAKCARGRPTTLRREVFCVEAIFKRDLLRKLFVDFLSFLDLIPNRTLHDTIQNDRLIYIIFCTSIGGMTLSSTDESYLKRVTSFDMVWRNSTDILISAFTEAAVSTFFICPKVLHTCPAVAPFLLKCWISTSHSFIAHVLQYRENWTFSFDCCGGEKQTVIFRLGAISFLSRLSRLSLFLFSSTFWYHPGLHWLDYFR